MAKQKAENAETSRDEELAELREQVRLLTIAVNKLLKVRGEEELPVGQSASG